MKSQEAKEELDICILTILFSYKQLICSDNVAYFYSLLYITPRYFYEDHYMERMKVVLLRRIAKLGTIGDVVSVKPGFARNYLLPKNFALRATEENMKYFEAQREKIISENAKSKEAAEIVAKKLNGVSVVLIRQASEKGQLYGSVTARDIASSIKVADYKVTASQVNLNIPIKALGIYEVSVELHPEVIISVNLNVAKSEEEALIQAEENSKDSSRSESKKQAKVKKSSDDSEKSEVEETK